MQSRKLEYSDGSTAFIGELFSDETQGTRRPGVLVFPDAFGLHDHARERARRLVDLGYIALAVDPHGEGRVYGDIPSVAPRMQALVANRPLWRAQARAALDALSAQPAVDPKRVGAIGFCFGGASCLELARSGASLAAIVTFHGSLLPALPEDASRIRAKVLICHGADDPLVKHEALAAVRTELTQEHVDWQILVLGHTVHSFTDPRADSRNLPGLAYSRSADVRSWSAMRCLLDEVFNP